MEIHEKVMKMSLEHAPTVCKDKQTCLSQEMCHKSKVTCCPLFERLK